MADIRKYLIPSETPVVVTRRHWASLIKHGSICALVALLGLLLLTHGGGEQAVSAVGVVAILIALGWFSWDFASWSLESFIITDRRVLLIYGILTHRVGIMPLSKVTDLTYERSLPGRLLGYGAFVIESAGQHQAFSRIEFLPSSDVLYHDVSLLLFPDHNGYSRRQQDHPTAPLPKQR
jgi:uncharacterized membrane protein YdbT with pleckstrin-like domain